MKALLVAAAAALLIAAPAQAMPDPYGRGDASTAIHAKQTKQQHRLIPRPGSNGSSVLCRSGSKAARWAC